MRPLVLVLVLAACGTSVAVPVGSPVSTSDAAVSASQVSVPTATSADVVDECAHVIDGVISAAEDGTFDIAATVASDDQGWDKYADAWIVRLDGVEVARRVLTHPHDTEQPFTRSLLGIDLQPGALVVLSANDSVVGECGADFSLIVP